MVEHLVFLVRITIVSENTWIIRYLTRECAAASGSDEQVLQQHPNFLYSVIRRKLHEIQYRSGDMSPKNISKAVIDLQNYVLVFEHVSCVIILVADRYFVLKMV